MALISSLQATDFHVAANGDDTRPGTPAEPLRSIQRAADLAQPGDTVTVHAGIYRERINPPRGGYSDEKRIVYRAAPGEKVEVRGSEVVKGWQREKGDVWKATLPKTFFGNFNPFADEIHGDWFNGQGRKHHTGAVYLNGEWLTEAVSLDDLLLPAGDYPGWLVPAAGRYLMNVAWLEAAGRTQATAFVAKSGEIRSAASAQGDECIGWITDGDTVSYDAVDFGEGREEIRIRVASASTGGRIEIRLDQVDGELLGTAEFSATGDWQKWTTVTAQIRPTSGKRDVCLVLRRPPLDHDSIRSALEQRNIGPLWYAEVAGDGSTTVWAQFPGVDPNRELVEVNARQSVFYPDQPGRNFITVRGFILSQAATNWAPPTAEQIGLIGTHWSKGWIIEDNVIHHSVCTGLTLGKHGDEYDNTSADSAEGYVETIKRAHAFRIPWDKNHIGHHLVRRNTISDCGQSGIVGSMGGAFSVIEDNEIHDIDIRQLLAGAEQAGIKLHGPIDTILRRNHIHRVRAFGGGIWLDWMTQGTRVTRNLLHDNSKDLFLEVNHGPYLVDNNIMLSPTNIWNWSEGGTFAHNLFGGSIDIHVDETRETPFHEAHSTKIKGLHGFIGGDDRYFNNLFVNAADLTCYDRAKLPVAMSGNVFFGGARPSSHERNAVVLPDAKTDLRLVGNSEHGDLSLTVPADWTGDASHQIITTQLAGETVTSGHAIENPDGSPVRIDTDFLGKSRNETDPTPGPFEHPGHGKLRFQVLPMPEAF